MTYPNRDVFIGKFHDDSAYYGKLLSLNPLNLKETYMKNSKTELSTAWAFTNISRKIILFQETFTKAKIQEW